MNTLSLRFDYPQSEIPLVLQSSYHEKKFYGVDQFESRRLKIILRKYGCRHNFHALPGHLTANLHPFSWNNMKQCFRIELDKKIPIHLNTLEEAIQNYSPYE